MISRTQIFSSPEVLVESLAKDLTSRFQVYANKRKICNIALSGGETPKILFSELADNYKYKINWEYIHFYWSDERCVPVDDPGSNFGTVKKLLLDKINISKKNIFRIKGDENPYEEVKRYSDIIHNNIQRADNIPQFDIIMLGLGEDGHVASIFSNHIELMTSDKICEVAEHPVTFQKRITLTGNIINNSLSVLFLITGEKKAAVVSNVIKNGESGKKYPASYIKPAKGELIWYLDKKAAKLL